MKFIFYLLFIFVAPSALASLNGYQTPVSENDLFISLESNSFENENKVQFTQKSINKVEMKLNEAMKAAISSFKNDYDEGNQTPLDLILDRAFEEDTEGIFNDQDLTKFAKLKLETLILSKGTSLALVNDKKAGEELGFDPSRNWVFELKIPSIQGFTFWCVISKNGDEQPFTFGEN